MVFEKNWNSWLLLFLTDKRNVAIVEGKHSSKLNAQLWKIGV